MADGRHIEYRFWLPFGDLLGDQREIWKWDEESHTILVTWPKLQFSQIQDGGRQPFWKQLYLHISAVSYPILIKFGTLMQISMKISMENWQKSKFFKFNMADRCHIENRILAISRLLIGRLTRNSEWGWWIICRYGSRDQNGNFRKLKTADGRHFENSFISITQSWTIRFGPNLVRRGKFPFRG